MNIPSAVRWAGFYPVVDGDGSAAVTGEILSCSAGVTTGRAKYVRKIQVRPGELFSFSVYARRVSGVDITSGGLSLDFPAEGTSVNTVRVVSSDWQKYELKYSIPITASATQHLTLSVGVFTADGGEVEFSFPEASVQNSSLGAPRVWVSALLALNAGAPSINAGFINSGVLGLAYNAGTATLTITTLPTAGANEIRPLFFCQMTTDAGTGATVLVPKIGNYDAASGTVDVKFLDVTTGAFVNIATFGLFYCFILGLI